MKVKLIQHTGKEILPKILGVCRNKECSEDTLQHCLTAKPVPHLSILEFIWFNFYVEGLSVKARIQLLRHRLFSTMERSTRSINMSEEQSFRYPDIGGSDAQKEFNKGYETSGKIYKNLINNGVKLEDAAYVLPMGSTTKFYLAGNGRVFFEYLQKRLCYKHVQYEHFLFAYSIYDELREAGYGDIFKHAIPCKSCTSCKGLKFSE